MTAAALPQRERPSRLSRIALGCYPLGGGYGDVDEQRARSTVDAALDAGWTFLDTAETYLESEERLGRILAGRRDRVFLATKAFPCEPFTPANLEAALEASLRRLQTDRIDLFQLHGPEDWVVPFNPPTPLDDLAEGLERLLDSGKVLRVGVCNWPAATLRELADRLDVFSSQNLYSLLDRGEIGDSLHLPVEAEIIPAARRLGIAFLAFSPLSRGLLADGLDPARTFLPNDERHFLPRYQAGIYEHYVLLARRLQEWANHHGHSLVQLAVAWTLANPSVTTTLVGAKSPAQVEAVGGADSWALSTDELSEIDAIVANLDVRARAAKMIVWDHFSVEALEGLRRRRYEHERS